MAHSLCSRSTWLLNGNRGQSGARIWTLPLLACIHISNDHTLEKDRYSYEKGTITPVIPLGERKHKEFWHLALPGRTVEKLMPGIERVRKRKVNGQSLDPLWSFQAHRQSWAGRPWDSGREKRVVALWNCTASFQNWNYPCACFLAPWSGPWRSSSSVSDSLNCVCWPWQVLSLSVPEVGFNVNSNLILGEKKS